MPRFLEFQAEYQVVADDTLASIVAAQCPLVTWEELAAFNWGSAAHEYVNHMLRLTVGMKTLNTGNCSLSALDPALGKATKVRIPRLYAANALAVQQTHTLTVKRTLPATGVSIQGLSKWFIPETEACDLSYRPLGIAERADKVGIEVYASNYCSVTPQEPDGVVSCTYAALDALSNPIWVAPADLTAQKAAVDTSHALNDWRGQSTAAAGMLKPRAGSSAHINVPCSPYTVLVRVLKSDADKKAKLLIEPFWVEFDNANAPVPASLRVKWKAKDCAKLKLGQFIITDKDGTEVYYHALAAADFADGDHDNADFANAVAGGLALDPARMPYRVQLQGQSDVHEDAGLALAAMHTEVRLWVHQDVGTNAPPNQMNDPQCLKFKQAAFLPLRNLDSPGADISVPEGSFKWYKLKLAEAGFHPGPVHREASTPEFLLAMKELQRIHPKVGGPPFKRILADGQRNSATKKVLQALLPAKRRALFGNAASKADVLPANVAGVLNQPTQELIAWIDDRHYHTDVGGAVLPYPKMGLENYGGTMDPPEATRIANEEASVARPWLPLAVELPLLGKADPLYPNAALPAVTDAMRRGVGPLRVNWTCTELDADLAPIDHAFYNNDGRNWSRTRRHVREVIAAQGTKNCHENNGGIAGTDDHKRPFGHADGTTNGFLAPWHVDPDDGNLNVFSYVHADVGQSTKAVHPPELGLAGVYLHPSRIAGDGYRLRAQVSFQADPVGAARNHPNRAALEKRYPKLPQAHTSALRLWRKASFRAFVEWSQAPTLYPGSTWAAITTTVGQRYTPAFCHYVHEDPAGARVVAPFTPVRSKVQDEYRKLMHSAIGASSGHRNWYPSKSRMRLNGTHFWPWLTEAHYGLPWRKLPSNSTAMLRSWLTGNNAGEVKGDTSNEFRDPLIHWVLHQVEQQTGLFAGHLCVRWNAVPDLWMRTYKCNANNHVLVVPERTQASAEAQDSACPSAGCGGRLKRQYQKNYQCTACNTVFAQTESSAVANAGAGVNCPSCAGVGTIAVDATPQVPPALNHNDEVTTQYGGGTSGLGGEPGVGTSLGSLWLYMADLGTNTRTCAHEFGHHRHLRHTRNATPGETDVALDTHHDGVANPNAVGQTWAHRCMMSYAANPGVGGGYDPLRYFCGPCSLKLRGWKIMGLAAPAGALSDP